MSRSTVFRVQTGIIDMPHRIASCKKENRSTHSPDGSSKTYSEQNSEPMFSGRRDNLARKPEADA